MSTAMEYATAGERTVARKLIRTLLGKGRTISVNDGEEWTVRLSTDEREILNALATTDADSITAHGPDGESQGWFYLVWGNDPAGEELIADHTDNDLCNWAANEVAGYEY